ncbi:MFS transporter [uncultured Amnibacterium sp.]|uniref:MFS transporter n=1 Tax=uncultured Amnibacterium sp. TaxID=1631851 RepID=UPI0035CA94D2
MQGRRAEAGYLLASVPLRLVSSGTELGLTLVAVRSLHDLALGAALIAVLTAPSVIAAPAVGAVLDAVRSPGRAMTVAAVLLAAALAVAAFAGSVPLPVVIVTLGTGGLALPVFLGGLSSFAGDLMSHDAARGFAIDALSYNVASVAGPAVVATAVAVASPRDAMLLLALLALIGGALLALLPIHRRVGTDGGSASAPAPTLGVLAGIRAGVTHLLTHPPLARATASATLTQVGAGALPVVAVAFALQTGAAASGGGVLLTAFAVGGLAGAGLATLPAIARRLSAARAEVVMGAGFAVIGLCTLLAAVAPTLPLAVVAYALSGLPDAAAIAALFRIRRSESPAAVQAQVFTVGSGLRTAAAALGAALVGLVVHADARLLTVGVGVVWVASALLLVRRRVRTSVRPNPGT